MHIETQFPTDISYGSTGGSRYKTSVITLASGFEQRNIEWSKSRAEFDVSHGVQSKESMNLLVEFFNVMQGRANSFRMKDWSDYQISDQSIGIGDGVETDFQIFKRYSVHGVNYDREITKIVDGTLTYTVDGNPGIVGVINVDTGVLSFSMPVPLGFDVLVEYVEFDLPCRFDTDALNISQDYFETQSWSSIPIVEVRV